MDCTHGYLCHIQFSSRMEGYRRTISESRSRLTVTGFGKVAFRICTQCRLTSRRSQPPLALSVPLSRFTSRVGGGSAFFVRRHKRMSIPLPPSSQKLPQAGLNRITKMLLVVGALGGICIAMLIALRIFGLLYTFYIPTASMAPAVLPGDHVIMEGLTFL